MRAVEPITISSAAGTLTSTNVDGSADPAAWDSGTTYAAGDRSVLNQTIFESKEDANTNNSPATTDKWIEVGPVNSLAMFDRRVGSQTINPDTITVTITPGRVVDTLSLLNVSARTITVSMTDPVDGPIAIKDPADGVLKTSITIRLQERVNGWWQYLYFPIVRKTAALITGLPPYRNASITIVITKTGGDAACGACILGLSLQPGSAEHGASDGIDDYSVIEKDAFGIRDVVERGYADDAELTCWVPQNESERFRRFLVSRRAQPTLFVLADSRPDAQYFGLPSFRRVFQFHKLDVFSLTIKGF
ncbi:MAG: hypothetical protein KIS62_01240 [Ramlibacter sp.]|nr:hypothetical protein [Ramlibacter sp.]